MAPVGLVEALALVVRVVAAAGCAKTASLELLGADPPLIGGNGSVKWMLERVRLRSLRDLVDILGVNWLVRVLLVVELGVEPCDRVVAVLKEQDQVVTH